MVSHPAHEEAGADVVVVGTGTKNNESKHGYPVKVDIAQTP